MRYLVRWNIASLPREAGGLGIDCVLKRNKCLLSKWGWRFSVEISTLWHMVVASLYGYDHFGWNAVPKIHGSSRIPWNNINEQ